MNSKIELQVLNLFNTIIRAQYKRTEFNTEAVRYPAETGKDFIARKFETDTYQFWEKYQDELKEKIDGEFSIKPFSFPGNTFYGVKIFLSKIEILRNGHYLYVSMNSPFYTVYSISNGIKIEYPDESDLKHIHLFKEVYKELLGVELPHKYWGMQPEAPYYYDEHEPDKKLAYFDLFFGGPSLYGGPFHKDSFAPINEYGRKLEENFIQDLGSIMLLNFDPLFP